jgi:hypothetical protein
MTLLLILLACSIGVAFLIVPVKSTKKKKKVDHNDHYKVPPIFWDEYNWLTLKIHRMTKSDYENVQHHINQFMYKYEQLVEYKVYNEKVAHLLSSYQFRVSLLLNNKHLENGTSV